MSTPPAPRSFLKSPEEIAADRAAREKAAAGKMAARRPSAGLSPEANLPFARHVLVCSGPHCNGMKQGHAIKAALEAECKKLGVEGVKFNAVNCFDLCSTAPNCIVYPDGVIYSHVKATDAAEIVGGHLKGNKPVARLKRSPQ